MSRIGYGTPTKSLINVEGVYSSTDGGTDAFTFDAFDHVIDGQILTIHIPNDNNTDSPTLENTGGNPSGAKSIVTTQGVAFSKMLGARPHRFMYDGGNDRYVVLDPAGGVVAKITDSNGICVRYEDGTQICRAKIINQATTSNGIFAWSFPANFISSDDLFSTIIYRQQDGQAQDFIHGVVQTAGLSSSSAGFRSFTYDVSANSFVRAETITVDEAYLFAQGRWK